MERISISEYGRSIPITLSDDEVDVLRAVAPTLRVELPRQASKHFEIVADSNVGLIRLRDRVIEIRPKVAMDRFFFLLSYAVDPTRWRDDEVAFAADDGVLEAVAPIFCRLIARATYLGLLHGYRVHESAEHLVKGQIRFRDQMQRRYCMHLPVELRYDEFTEDIDENRLILAALDRLRRLPLRSAKVQRGLNEIMAAFHAVSLVNYLPRDLPTIRFSRLNQHYEPAINLATLILRATSLELGASHGTGTVFLVDMNDVFEAFVHRALRESLGLNEHEFPRGSQALRLDAAKRIKLEPDLSWWHKGRCRFVGDVKYKRINIKGIKHADIYQLLAYAVSASLPTGLLIYAAGEGNPARHDIPHAGKTLLVRSLDLAHSPECILRQIEAMATVIRTLAEQANHIASQPDSHHAHV